MKAILCDGCRKELLPYPNPPEDIDKRRFELIVAEGYINDEKILCQYHFCHECGKNLGEAVQKIINFSQI